MGSYWSDNVKWLIDWSACNIGIEKTSSSNYAAKVVEDWFLLSIGICISQVSGTRKGSVNIGVYEGNSRDIGECVWSYSDTFIFHLTRWCYTQNNLGSHEKRYFHHYKNHRYLFTACCCLCHKMVWYSRDVKDRSPQGSLFSAKIEFGILSF